MQRARSTATGLWSALALLVGHWAAYRFVYGTGHELEHALHDSGHSWISLAGPAAVLFLSGAFGASVVAARQRHTRATLSYKKRFATMAALQLGAYTLIELTERAANGYSWSTWHHELFHHRGLALLLVGLLAQLVSAALGALLAAAVERIASLRQRRERRVSAAASTWDDVVLTTSRFSSLTVRGPPAPSLQRFVTN